MTRSFGGSPIHHSCKPARSRLPGCLLWVLVINACTILGDLHAASGDPTISWVGGSGDWNDTAHWNTGILPSADDEVSITGPETNITVTLGSGHHAVKSVLSHQNLVLAGGSLSVSDTLQVNDRLTLSGGILRNATVLTGAGGQGIVCTASGGMLDGVELAGDLDLTQVHQARVVITNGLSLVAGTVRVGHAENGWPGRLQFAGSQELGGTGTVVLGNSGHNAMYLLEEGTTLTVGPGIRVGGHSGMIGAAVGYPWYGPAAAGWVNLGTIAAEVAGGTLTLNGEPALNQGTLEVLTGATLLLKGSLQVDSPGRIAGQLGAHLRAGGHVLGNTTLREHYLPTGTLSLAGTGTGFEPQLLEVMSQDLGATPEGFARNFT